MSTNHSQSSPVRSSSPVDPSQDDNISSGTESGIPSKENGLDNFETRTKLTKQRFQYYLERRQRPDSGHPPPGVSLVEDRVEVAHPEAKGEPKRRAPTIQRCGAFYENYPPPVRKETPAHGIKVLVTSENGTLVTSEDDQDDQEFVLIEFMDKMTLGSDIPTV